MPQVINDSKTMQLVSKWKFVEPEICTWTQDKETITDYLTSCGKKYGFNYAGIKYAYFVYCPYCGKPIKDIPYLGKD
jgi:hypothetical protein